jgi:hypothetical protein
VVIWKGARLEVFMALKAQVFVYWVMTPCSDVVGYLVAAWSSKMLVSYHITTGGQTPEDHDLYLERG